MHVLDKVFRVFIVLAVAFPITLIFYLMRRDPSLQNVTDMETNFVRFQSGGSGGLVDTKIQDLNEKLLWSKNAEVSMRKRIADLESRLVQDQQSGPKFDKGYFEIKDYEGKSFDVMMKDYCEFHKQMVEGKIPPRFVLAEISNAVEAGEGFGNRVERVVWCFLYTLLTGRAFLFKFEDMYQVSNQHFSGPCFNWNYHRDPKFAELEKTPMNFQDTALQNEHLPTYCSEIPVIHLLNYQRTFNTEGHSPFRNPNYKHVIPKVLGNWKSTLLHWLFSNPSQQIRDEIQSMKQTIKLAGYTKLMTIQFRSWGYTQAVRKEDIQRYIDCANYLTRDNPAEWAFFLATDNTEIKNMMKTTFPDQLFSNDVAVFGPNDGEFAGNKKYEQNNKLSGSAGVLIDWYMLGEGDAIMHTAASSFGISAADRGLLWKFPSRFVMGGLTQCTNPDGDYYAEKIYKSPLETYEENKDHIEWIPFIQ